MDLEEKLDAKCEAYITVTSVMRNVCYNFFSFLKKL